MVILKSEKLIDVFITRAVLSLLSFMLLKIKKTE